MGCDLVRIVDTSVRPSPLKVWFDALVLRREAWSTPTWQFGEYQANGLPHSLLVIEKHLVVFGVGL
jgi:hypothetical protein